MIEFSLSKDEARKIGVFKDVIYASVNQINRLDDDVIFAVKDDGITIHAYGDTASGKYAGASQVVASTTKIVKDPSVETSWFTISLDRIVKAFLKAPNGDILVKVDTKDQKIWTTNPTTEKKENMSLSYNKILSDAEVKEHIDEFESFIKNDTRKQEDSIHINHTLLDICNNIYKVLKIGATTDAISIGKKHVKTSDSASIIEVTNPGKDFIDNDTDILLDANSIPLLANILKTSEDFDLNIYKEGPATINSINLKSIGVQVIWTNKTFNYEPPSEKDYIDAIPDETNKTKIEVKRSEIKRVLEGFDGVFKPMDWKYGQVKFNWDTDINEGIVLSYETVDASRKLTFQVDKLVENNDPEPKHSFYIPTLYLSYLLNIEDSMEEEKKKEANLIFEFNSLGPRSPHGVAINIYDDTIKVCLCKLIK
jgi:hypothetical protein